MNNQNVPNPEQQPQIWQPAATFTSQPQPPTYTPQQSAQATWQDGAANAPATPYNPAWQRAPAEVRKKKPLGITAMLALCAVMAILINLGGMLIYNAILSTKRSVYTNPILVSTVNSNPWSRVVEDTYDSSVSFAVDGGNEGSWHGSGVIISPDGYILTNDHVAGDPAIRKIECTLRNGMSFTGTLIAKDEQNDLALVKIDADTELDYVKIGNSDLLQVGDQVITVGFPLGSFADTVAEGIISHTNREMQIASRPGIQQLIQVTAPISSGNSGGALLNYRGELVAIVNARATSLYSDGGIIDAENIGFCIPIHFAIDLIRGSTEDISIPDIPTLGITAISVSKQEAKKSAIYPVAGVYIDKVTTYGAGWYAGLQNYDRIVSIDKKDVTAPEDVEKLISKAQIGEEIVIIIERDAVYYQYTIETMRDYG